MSTLTIGELFFQSTVYPAVLGDVVVSTLMDYSLGRSPDLDLVGQCHNGAMPQPSGRITRFCCDER